MGAVEHQVRAAASERLGATDICRGGMPDAVAAVIGGIAAGLLFVVVHRALTDDAYITLSYARNLAFHGHWGLTQFRSSNVATSPLNVWLLAALILPTRAPVLAAGLLLMATMGSLAVWANRISRLIRATWLMPVAAVALLLVNPLLMSAVGLETFLAAALMAGMAYYALAQRVVLTGVLAGLLVLTRPDLVVVAAVIVLMTFGLRRPTWVAGLIGIAVVLPWHVFSWFVLGTAVPDTFAFKTVAGRFDDQHGATLAHALVSWYGSVWPEATVLSVAPATVGLVCLLACVFLACRRKERSRWSRVAIAFGLAGLAHWAVLAFVVAPDPYTWYYAPLLTGLTMTAAVTLGVVHVQARSPVRVGVPGLMVCLTSATVGWLCVGPVPLASMPMNGNWGLAAEYARAGNELPKGVTVGSPGELGTLAYFCDCDIVDWMSDRGRAKSHIEARMRAAGPVMRWLLRLNYRHFPEIPPAHADYGLFLEDPVKPGGIKRWPVTSPVHGRHALILTK